MNENSFKLGTFFTIPWTIIQATFKNVQSNGFFGGTPKHGQIFYEMLIYVGTRPFYRWQKLLAFTQKSRKYIRTTKLIKTQFFIYCKNSSTAKFLIILNCAFWLRLSSALKLDLRAAETVGHSATTKRRAVAVRRRSMPPRSTVSTEPT